MMRPPIGFLAQLGRLARLGVIGILGAGALGCSSERDVDMSLVTTSMDGQSVSHDQIELGEGQALGIRVYAVKNGKVKDDWNVRATSRDPSVAHVRQTTKQHVFAINGAKAGHTQIGFKARDRTVYVDVTVYPRPEWQPEAEPYAFGGAGGLGGFGGAN
ncbi:MAG TPA: hypothetical protein VN764_04670 [Polyangiaceae bacterium]|nr:hypothetical protein [Polyangiaceae bacterium]